MGEDLEKLKGFNGECQWIKCILEICNYVTGKRLFWDVVNVQCNLGGFINFIL